MSSIKGSVTEKNLRRAFIQEARASRNHLVDARQADAEGDRAAARVAILNAESEISHAFGHLEYLEMADDPVASGHGGRTEHVHEFREVYPGMARTAREEGFDDIADWLEILAKGRRSRSNRRQRALQDEA